MKTLALTLVMLTLVSADGDNHHHHDHHAQHAQHGNHGAHHVKPATQHAHHPAPVKPLVKSVKPVQPVKGVQHHPVHHGPRPVQRKPLRPLAPRRPLPLKRRPVQPFNPFLAAQRVLPHNPRPIRGLHNNLPVRPPRPHQAHHPRRPSVNSLPSTPTKAPTAVNKPGKSVAALIAENEHFSTLHTALKAAGMMENLAGAGPFTVFAPTNAAFDKVPVDSLNKLMGNQEELIKVLERLDQLLLGPFTIFAPTNAAFDKVPVGAKMVG